MGVATLTAGWHRPSDAVAAFAVVVAWGAGLSAAAFTGLVGVLAARRRGRLDAIDLGQAYASATIAVTGSALLLVGLLLAALRPVDLDVRRESGALRARVAARSRTPRTWRLP